MDIFRTIERSVFPEARCDDLGIRLPDGALSRQRMRLTRAEVNHVRLTLLSLGKTTTRLAHITVVRSPRAQLPLGASMLHCWMSSTSTPRLQTVAETKRYCQRGKETARCIKLLRQQPSQLAGGATAVWFDKRHVAHCANTINGRWTSSARPCEQLFQIMFRRPGRLALDGAPSTSTHQS